MNSKQLVNLLHHSSPKSILIVTYNKKIMELRCPFWVLVTRDIGDLKKGNKEQVELVKLSYQLKTVFIINGDAYYYYHFTIMID